MSGTIRKTPKLAKLDPSEVRFGSYTLTEWAEKYEVA
jgi:hypothetical protein